jgi:hypothetical protein
MQMTTIMMKKEYMTGTSDVASAKRICFTCAPRTQHSGSQMLRASIHVSCLLCRKFTSPARNGVIARIKPLRPKHTEIRQEAESISGPSVYTGR